MDHKILILGITIFIVILLLSFRKEKYAEVNQEPEEEEQEEREQLVEDAYDLKTLLAQINALQADGVDKEKAVNAFYDDIYANTKYGPSAEEAGEAYNKEVEKQIEYLQTWLKLARGVEPGQEDKIRTEYEELLEAYVDGQAREWFGENYVDEGYDNILGKKGIVKVENNIGAVAYTNGFPTWNKKRRPVGYSSLMSQATGDPKYQTTSGLYHKENPKKHDYYMIVPKCGKRWDGEASCLDIKGRADKFVSEDGIVLQESLSNNQGAWMTCASACVNSPTDECSGFSLSIKDNKYRCKLTRDKYEDVKIKKIDNEIEIGGKTFLTGEDVYAIHEGYAGDNWDSYFKNPLYAELFKGYRISNREKKDIDPSRTTTKKFEEIKSDECSWRTDCSVGYSCPSPMFAANECENPKKIENDGLPENCEGSWKVDQISGQDKHSNGCPTKGPSGALGDKPCFNSDPSDSPAVRSSRRPTYTKRFSALEGGAEAINGGSCPEAVSTTMLCRDGDNGEQGKPLQICEYDHGGWYENPPINCGTDKFGDPAVVNTSRVDHTSCNVSASNCPSDPGYEGGYIYGTQTVTNYYPPVGKEPKNGAPSCLNVIKEKINANDSSWNDYYISGNDIVRECSYNCPNVPGYEDRQEGIDPCKGALPPYWCAFEDEPSPPPVESSPPPASSS